jgi:hypothetical protein
VREGIGDESLAEDLRHEREAEHDEPALAEAGQKGCGERHAKGSSAIAEIVVLHAMIFAVDAPESRATLIASM